MATLMGGMFIVLGLLNPPLLLWGALFLAVGLGLFCLVKRKKAADAKLIAQGQKVPAKIISTKHHTSTNLTFSRSKGRAALRAPWTAYCEYTWKGQTYTAKTNYLWLQPWTDSPNVVVYLDPAAPERGVVDARTIHFISPV